MTNTPIAATEGGLPEALAEIERRVVEGREVIRDLQLAMDGHYKVIRKHLDQERGPGFAHRINSMLLRANARFVQIGRAAESLATRTPAPSLGEDVVDGATRRRVAEAIVAAFVKGSPDLAKTISTDWRDWTDEADAALSSMRPVQEEGSLEPTCAQCGGLRDDLAPGRDPEELCDPCYDDAIKALKPVQEEGVGEDGWRPIESAPKDGTWFVALQDGDTYPCQWHLEENDEGPPSEGWFDHFNKSFEAPTHWKPVASHPEASPREDAGEDALRDALEMCLRELKHAVADGGTAEAFEAIAVAEGHITISRSREAQLQGAALVHPEASPPSLGVEELREALQANLNTMCEQVRRFRRWGKSHNELDAAIEETRAALSRVSGGV